MKLSAVGVTTHDLGKSVKFYEAIGFEFPEYKQDEDHLEPVTTPGSARLMIDSATLAESLIGEPPKPSNNSAFAVEFDSAAEVNAAAEHVQAAGFEVTKQPWDAFWGQRYCVVKDPDGYMVDLYAAL